ncbi:hypothetical protein KIN_02190 [Litoreibacter roseus]|uniref:Uncharacterized protein n=1 Tax=Litoreibacter roseus TaxID=2601869 RepID=A0A6N6JAD0_9RHOB|nr:hypothetical protein KIN_02190 [Litoreibacter roseus]
MACIAILSACALATDDSNPRMGEPNLIIIEFRGWDGAGAEEVANAVIRPDGSLWCSLGSYEPRVRGRVTRYATTEAYEQVAALIKENANTGAGPSGGDILRLNAPDDITGYTDVLPGAGEEYLPSLLVQNVSEILNSATDGQCFIWG